MNEKIDAIIKFLQGRTNLTFSVAEVNAIISHLNGMKETEKKEENQEDIPSKKQKNP